MCYKAKKMKFIADFHIHSHYSLATSSELTPEHLAHKANVKGIKVIGSGDFTHPKWTAELKEKLIPAEEGLFKLKEEYKLPTTAFDSQETRFLLTAEISNIYKKHDKVRKIHSVIFAPDFEVATKIQNELQKQKFNITSDGRPILGLDVKKMLEMFLDISDRILFVPAHIWTPWFSILGDKSGFNSVEECFEDMSKYIYAVETGLSSDPPMNWLCSFLDKYNLLSNSDAHSPDKLGRNANIFDTTLSYSSIINAIKTGNPTEFIGTINFFPEEGKYHYDGHRKCNICFNPLETIRHNEKCPVCGKKLTVGVMSRVAEISDRINPIERKNRLEFYSLIPLKEILSEISGKSETTKEVTQVYNSLVVKAGSEFNILLNMSIEEIKNLGNEKLTEAIKRMRNREVFIKEGFDGEFGAVKVFGKDEKNAGVKNMLFAETNFETTLTPRNLISFDLEEYHKLKLTFKKEPEKDIIIEKTKFHSQVNEEQEASIGHLEGALLIVAGPGTGKTRTLAFRIANLIEKGVSPENILAITFTNKASLEIKKRIKSIVLEDKMPDVATFHGFGFSILKEYSTKLDRTKDFVIIDDKDKKNILKKIGVKENQVNLIIDGISKVKQNLKEPSDLKDSEAEKIFNIYENILEKENCFDLDDLIYQTVKLFIKFNEILTLYQEKYKWIMIDEYQDINYSQYQLIRMLMPDANPNLCVIGDPNQAIYGFRGADVKFINKFIYDYPASKVYQLKKSYRCSDTILKASGDLVDKTNLIEGLEKGVKIKITELATEKSEAEFIVRTIEQMIGGVSFFSMDSKISGGESRINSFSDFVILCRTKSQFSSFIEAFHNHNIPYQIVGEEPFFKQEPICTIIDIFKFIINPKTSFLKEKLIDKKIKVENLQKLSTVFETLDFIVTKFFPTQKETSKLEIEKLFDLSKDYEANFDDFLKLIALGTPIDTYNQNIEAVTVMTLHASKGLEFECVFIAGCEDGIIPYSIFKNCDIDEEKRLLYVGMTRAKKYLYLTTAKSRTIFGKLYSQKQSQFLKQIKKELIEAEKQEYHRKDDGQLSLF